MFELCVRRWRRRRRLVDDNWRRAWKLACKISINASKWNFFLFDLLICIILIHRLLFHTQNEYKIKMSLCFIRVHKKRTEIGSENRWIVKRQRFTKSFCQFQLFYCLYHRIKSHHKDKKHTQHWRQLAPSEPSIMSILSFIFDFTLRVDLSERQLSYRNVDDGDSLQNRFLFSRPKCTIEGNFTIHLICC